MIELELMYTFLIALAVGALIGLEREYARYKKKTYEYAGIRTFPLISLWGAIAAYLAEKYSLWILLAAVILVGLLIVIAYYLANKKRPEHLGVTTEVAGFLTFFLGVLAYEGHIKLVTSLAVALAVILYSRTFLHHFAEHINARELADTLKFAVIAFVILPFLPNKSYGPFELFNPFITWLMVVFISAISFMGYILLKKFGERGIPLLGFLGGIASSTATTSSLALRSVKEKGYYRSFAVGVLIANAGMFLVTLLEVFVLNRELFVLLLPSMLILGVLTVVLAYFLWRTSLKASTHVELSSPFTLLPAIKFALFFAAIIALVKLGHTYFSSYGVYAVSFISGFASIDAITISLSRLSADGISLELARDGILLAILTNIAVKSGIAYWFGDRKFGKMVVTLFSVLIAAGLLVLFLL